MSYSDYKYIYIILVFFLLVVGTFFEKIHIANEKRKNIYIITILSVIMGIFAAVRPASTPDTKIYIDFYQIIKEPSLYIRNAFIVGSRILGIEYSFAFIIALFKSINLSYRVLFFFVGFFNSLVFLLIPTKIAELVECNPNRIQITSVFFCYFGLHYCCIALRAGLSLSFCLIATYFLYKKKVFATLFFAYVATLFHTMSMLFLVALVYMFCKKKKIRRIKEKTVTVIAFCAASLSLGLGGWLTKTTIGFIQAFFNSIKIYSFSGYLYGGLDLSVGIKDWFTLVSFGIILIWVSKRTRVPSTIVELSLVGILIISIFYPIRAINRASDYFLILLLPSIGAMKKRNTQLSLFSTLVAYPLMLAVQLNL